MRLHAPHVSRMSDASAGDGRVNRQTVGGASRSIGLCEAPGRLPMAAEASLSSNFWILRANSEPDLDSRMAEWPAPPATGNLCNRRVPERRDCAGRCGLARVVSTVQAVDGVARLEMPGGW